MTARRFAGLCCTSLAVAAALRFGAPKAQTFVSRHLPVAEVKHQSLNTPRKVFAYSVIPGGAYSRDELALALRVDPVAAAHYSDFQASNASVHLLEKDTYLYVSYRKADQVYWTITKHRIPKGELLLTDGPHLARTRCGNRLSGIPEFPVAHGPQPSELALNAPELPSGIALPQPPVLRPQYDGPFMPLASPLARDFAFPLGSTAMRGLPEGFPAIAFPGAYTGVAALPLATTPNSASHTGPPGPTGVTPGGPIPVASVPEPQSAALLAVGGVFLTLCGIRFRRTRPFN